MCLSIPQKFSPPHKKNSLTHKKAHHVKKKYLYLTPQGVRVLYVLGWRKYVNLGCYMRGLWGVMRG